MHVEVWEVARGGHTLVPQEQGGGKVACFLFVETPAIEDIGSQEEGPNSSFMVLPYNDLEATFASKEEDPSLY